jgi:hypothetical protein
LLVRRELAARCLRQRLLERLRFGRAENDGGLLIAGELEQKARQIILHLRGQGANGIDSLFKKLRHHLILADRSERAKPSRRRRKSAPRGRPASCLRGPKRLTRQDKMA